MHQAETRKEDRDARRRAVGERIVRARKAKGLSQSQLALLAGVQAQSISKLERGVFSPSAETLLRIADACGVDPRWIAMLEGPETPLAS